METVGARLQEEGVDLFLESFDGVVDIVDQRRGELLQRREA